MKLLAIECSAVTASCAVTEDGAVLAYAYTGVKLTHSQTLLPMVRDMLRNAGILLEDIGAFAVAAGPGSFTGVRIGVATVKGLAVARDVPCIPVSSLEAAAQNMRGLPFTGFILAAMDARCGQVYTALFFCESGIIRRVTPDDVKRMKELVLPEAATTLLVGDGAALCYAALSDKMPELMLAPAHLRMQNAVGVALVADVKNAVAPEALLPLYLRAPQAERERHARG